MANLTAKKPGKIVTCPDCGDRVDPFWHCCALAKNDRAWQPYRGNVFARLWTRLRRNG